MMGSIIKKVYKKRNLLRATGFLLPVVLTVVSSCTRNLDLPKVQAEKKIVLIGELTGGEPALLRAGQSLPLAEGNELKFSIIEGLEVKLEDENGIVQQLSGSADEMTPVLYTVPFKSTTVLSPGGRYKLTATHSNLGIATADFTVPPAFTSSIIDTTSTSYAGVSVFELGIQIDDLAGESNYYVIEAIKQYIDVTGFFNFGGQWYDLNGNKRLYDSLNKANLSFIKNFDTTFSSNYSRQPVYTTDPSTDNLMYGNSLNPSKRILLRDVNFNGTSYTTNISVDKSQFLATGYIDRGQIVITVKSVSEDYYNYLVAYEQTEPGLDPNQPVRIKGNVNNGLGMIGAVYTRRFTYFFDSWGY